MAYDLIIRGGLVVDGSGLPGYRADVGIHDGIITAIGDLAGEHATEVIDAEGKVVAPGFVDAHTHMDAQVFWDNIGTNSCWHGVTSVVMGNCGFSLAPCAEKDKLLVLHNLQMAEAISIGALDAGVPWTWDTFPEYLDAVEALPKGLNYAAYVGHSALRTHAMGQRAMEEQANEDDLATMKRALEDGMRAGAVGGAAHPGSLARMRWIPAGGGALFIAVHRFGRWNAADRGARGSLSLLPPRSGVRPRMERPGRRYVDDSGRPRERDHGLLGFSRSGFRRGSRRDIRRIGWSDRTPNGVGVLAGCPHRLSVGGGGRVRGRTDDPSGIVSSRRLGSGPGARGAAGGPARSRPVSSWTL